MRKIATKKDWKRPGVKVYFIDDAFNLWIWHIREVGETETLCEMVNQHVKADKNPVKMKILNNNLREEHN